MGRPDAHFAARSTFSPRLDTKLVVRSWISVREGIHELRIRQGTVQYRILYFSGLEREIVFVHGLRKEREIPEMDIRRALKRKSIYETDPTRFRHEQEEDEDQDA